MDKTTPHALQIEHVPVDSLRPDPANPRRISDAELESLTRSIQQFGLVDPIIARHDDRIVIGGHQRLLAAHKLGLETVPVVFIDLPPEQAKLLNLALNKISGEWDQELLARLLADLDDAGADLALSGFGEDEVAKLLKSLDSREKRERPENFDLDAALEEAQRAPLATRGDMWGLGDHRLLCGDATDQGDVAGDARNPGAGRGAGHPGRTGLAPGLGKREAQGSGGYSCGALSAVCAGSCAPPCARAWSWGARPSPSAQPSARARSLGCWLRPGRAGRR